MTAVPPRPETGQSEVAASGEPSPQLDYSKVQAYWKRARPSMLGPYMMDGFGFPVGAGHFRFRGELKAVAEAIRDVPEDASVLDLGSGVGVWTEYFAQRFAKVIAVEGSSALYEALKDRCARYPNVTAYHRDVLSFEEGGEPEATGGFGLVFLGGLLMYLNDHDVRAMLRRLIPCLRPDAVVLCRESTVRHDVKTLQGDYQVVYRSVDTYRRMLVDAGFDLVSVRANTAYINVQMACELIKKWKALVPDRLQCLPVVGRLTYWAIRFGYPWNTKWFPWLGRLAGREFPSLTNHFFVLRPSPKAVSHRRDSSSREPRIQAETLEKAR